MRLALLRLALSLVILVAGAAPALAQSGTTRTALSGTVLDSGGGALPGVSVEVKHNRTGVVTATVTNDTGVFDVPAIDAGFYTITVSLSGFKTVVLTDVELLSGTPRAIKVTLEVGQLTEADRGARRRRSWCRRSRRRSRPPSASTRSRTCRSSRATASTWSCFSPASTRPRNNHSQRQSTFSGLPTSALSITVDGANIQDKYTRSTDGFFANIHPKLDLIEEVTVSTRDGGRGRVGPGRGADQVRHAVGHATTFTGSAYDVPPPPESEHATTTSTADRRPADEPAEAQSVGRPRRRADRLPVTTAAARRSSSSTSSSCGFR